MGEYHFIANDAETSGGPAEDGLSIFLVDENGGLTDTNVFWDDVTVLGDPNGTTTLPDGESSGTSAGRHTWGDFSSTGFGNVRYIDTYVLRPDLDHHNVSADYDGRYAANRRRRHDRNHRPGRTGHGSPR